VVKQKMDDEVLLRKIQMTIPQTVYSKTQVLTCGL